MSESLHPFLENGEILEDLFKTPAEIDFDRMAAESWSSNPSEAPTIPAVTAKTEEEFCAGMTEAELLLWQGV